MPAALRRVAWWAVAVVLSAVLLVTGALPWGDAWVLGERVLPVLGFVAR